MSLHRRVFAALRAALSRRVATLNESAEDIQVWRNRLLDGLCAAAFGLGLLVILPSMLGAGRQGHWTLVATDVVALIGVGLLHLRRDLAYRLRVTVLLAICYLISVVLLFSIGPISQIYLMAVPVLCTVLIGSAAAVRALLLCTATLLLAGLVGGIEPGVAVLTIAPLLHWIVISINFLLVAAMLVVSCSYLQHGLDGALTRQRASHVRIHDNEIRYRQTLEAQIAMLHAREAALRASETRYAAIFNLVPDAILLTRLCDDRVLEVNRGFEDISGWSRAEAIGRSSRMLRLIAPATRAHLRGAVRGGRGQVKGMESTFLTRGGAVRQAFLSTTVFELDGEMCALTVIQDVTDERRQELALRESMAAQRAAEVSNELKSEFLAMISHEVRTPLGGVIGMLRLAQKDASLAADTRGKLRISLSNAEVLLQIINDILDFSRLEAGKMPLEVIDFDLPALLHDVLGLLRDRAEARNISLLGELDPGLPVWWRGDPTRLRQVVLNLVGNGIKFTERGQVSLDVRVVSGGGIVLTVRDTGIGIAPAALGALFQKFEQGDAATSRKYGGTGLGLAICKNIVSAMDGRIEVSSEVGVGSVFQVMLPLQPGTAVTGREAELRRPHAGRLVVLCVEDGGTNQIILRELLGNMGHTVTIAEDGVVALAELACRDYDLVIMDSRMPRMDGLTALRRLRAGADGVRHPGLPVIALTANATGEERARFLAAGANGFLSKPINDLDLHAEIARQIDVLLAQGHALIGEETARVAGAPTLAELDAMFGLSDAVVPVLPRRRTGDGPSAAMCAAFLIEGPRLLEVIQQGLASGNMLAVALGAHSLLGSAGYFGADRLAKLCGHIEQLADAGQLDAVAPQVAMLKMELAMALSRLTPGLAMPDAVSMPATGRG